ncbi:hypothetical protein ACSBR2_014761 [Camellia fascicularis]
MQSSLYSLCYYLLVHVRYFGLCMLYFVMHVCHNCCSNVVATWINPEHCLRHPKTCISGAIVSPTHSLYMCTKQFRTPAILGTCCQGVGIQLQEMCPYNDNARLLGCVQGLPGTYGQVPRGEATPKQVQPT